MDNKQYANRLKIPIYLLSIFFVFMPLIYMFFISFMTRGEQWGIKYIFTLANYKALLEPLYVQIFWNSIKISVTSVICLIVLGYPFGYFMSRLKGRWKGRIMVLLLLPFWMSGLIRLYGWVIAFRSNGVLDKLLMGFNITQEPLKLLYSYEAVIAGIVYTLLPFMILSVYASVEKMDWTLVEAAKDLGASELKAFLTITLPMTKAGLLSGVVLTLVPSMGLFFIAEILGGNKVVLIGTIIQELSTRGNNQPLAAAMSVVLLCLTWLSIWGYKKITKMKNLEGL